jgi:tetratricopeptide (TPR) repeat protein
MIRRVLPLGLLLGLGLSLHGCFLKSIAVDSIADSLAGTGDTFSSDNDPQLIRDAIPFSLKLMESVLSAAPRHVGLLTAACKGFTEYAYAFVQSDMERMEDSQYEKKKAWIVRAKNLYLRAQGYGLRGLNARHDKFSDMLKADPKGTAAKANKDDVELLYWTAASWLGAIVLDKGDNERMAEEPQAETLLYRAYALDPDYDKGAIEDFLITYEGGKPAMMGGSAKKAREHFDRALVLNKGLDATTYLNYAEAVDEKAQNKDEFEEMLNKALVIDPDKDPSNRLVNLLMQERARWLLANEDKLFL